MGTPINPPGSLTLPTSKPPSLVKPTSSLETAKQTILAAKSGAALLSTVTLQQANEVLADLAKPTPTCTPLQANEMARQLIGLCPVDSTLDAELAPNGLAAIFCEYAFDVVATVCHPRGLPRRQKYGLKLADVDEALKAEVNRRLSLYSGARYVVDQTAKRRAEQEQSLTPDEIEKRKRHVAALLSPRQMDYVAAKGSA